MEDIGSADHETSHDDGKDAAVMDSVKGVGDRHEDADHQDKEDNKLLKSHVGGKGHDSHTVRGQDVAGAN